MYIFLFWSTPLSTGRRVCGGRYLSVCTYGGQRLTLGVMLHHSPPYFWVRVLWCTWRSLIQSANLHNHSISAPQCCIYTHVAISSVCRDARSTQLPMLAVQTLHLLTVSPALVTEWCMCACMRACVRVRSCVHTCARVCLRAWEPVNNHSGVTLEVGTGFILLLQ